jgi:hypothetical protein
MKFKRNLQSAMDPWLSAPVLQQVWLYHYGKASGCKKHAISKRYITKELAENLIG